MTCLAATPTPLNDLLQMTGQIAEWPVIKCFCPDYNPHCTHKHADLSVYKPQSTTATTLATYSISTIPLPHTKTPPSIVPPTKLTNARPCASSTHLPTCTWPLVSTDFVDVDDLLVVDLRGCREVPANHLLSEGAVPREVLRLPS